MAVSYSDLVNKNGTIYNARTSEGYPTPAALARALGVPESSIQWNSIQSNPNWQPQAPAPSPSPTPAPTSTQTTTSQPAQSGGLQMNYDGILADIYAQRPDLQELYGTDGRALNPNDPRVAGIPSILDWAEQFGSKEYNTLQGFNAAQYGQPQQPTEYSTGDPNLDALLGQFDQLLQNQAAQGKQFDPNIELTPDVVKKFLDQATKEVSPYYQNQIKVIRKDLDNNLGELMKAYQLSKQQAESDFKANLSAKREQLAGDGLAYSGVRGQQEQKLREDTSRSLESAANSAASKARSAILDTESKIGSRNLNNLSFSGLTEFDADTAGSGGFTSGRSLNFGTIGGVTGDLEYNQNRDVRNLTDYLKSQEVQKRTLNFQGA
jgi:hypothetical protein